MSKPYGFNCTGAYPTHIRWRLDVPAEVPDPTPDDPSATKQVRQARLELFGEMICDDGETRRFVYGMPVPPEQFGDPTPIVLDEVPADQHNGAQKAAGAVALMLNQIVAKLKQALADYDYAVEPGTIEATVRKPV